MNRSFVERAAFEIVPRPPHGKFPIDKCPETWMQFDCQLTRPGGFVLSAAFECGRGVTALLGPSGSGKSTVLSLIAGLVRPDAGRICCGDEVLVDTKQQRFVPPERRGIGLVFQEGCLFPHLTVEQNLAYGWSRNQHRRGEITHVAEILELRHLLHRPPATLSGGERQRVALGRALLRSPTLLLLDEPLSALDEPLQERILDYLRRALREFPVPTLLVTHNPRHLHGFAEQVITLEQGRVTTPGSANA